jgi:hypothetical protein
MGNRDHMISDVAIYSKLNTQYTCSCRYGSVTGMQFPIRMLLFAAPSKRTPICISRPGRVNRLNLRESPAVRATVRKSLGSATFHYTIPRFALPI